MEPTRKKIEMQLSSMQPSLMGRDTQIATILIAEDHLDSRDALRALLEAFGYRVLEAVNGRQAVEIALLHGPDLILMDIMMPELDGFEATRQLRRHARTNAIPIIAVTAMEGAHQLAIQAGANDYVRKPVDIRRLVAKVHDWLETPLP
jgi:CheY-like chemotaxis protein